MVPSIGKNLEVLPLHLANHGLFHDVLMKVRLHGCPRWLTIVHLVPRRAQHVLTSATGIGIPHCRRRLHRRVLHDTSARMAQLPERVCRLRAHKPARAPRIHRPTLDLRHSSGQLSSKPLPNRMTVKRICLGSLCFVPQSEPSLLLYLCSTFSPKFFWRLPKSFHC